MNEDSVGIGLKRINTLRRWRGASCGNALCVSQPQIRRLQELAAELHALYADVSGPQRLAFDRKITGTICELLRLDERMKFQDTPESAARRTA